MIANVAAIVQAAIALAAVVEEFGIDGLDAAVAQTALAIPFNGMDSYCTH